MKNNIKTKLSIATLVALFCNSLSVLAQDTLNSNNIKSRLTQVTSDIGEIVNPIINIALAIIGVIAIGVVVWAYAKKKKADPNANDALMDAAWTTIAIVAFVYIIKSFFFGL